MKETSIYIYKIITVNREVLTKAAGSTAGAREREQKRLPGPQRCQESTLQEVTRKLLLTGNTEVPQGKTEEAGQHRVSQEGPEDETARLVASCENPVWATRGPRRGDGPGRAGARQRAAAAGSGAGSGRAPLYVLVRKCTVALRIKTEGQRGKKA